MFMGPTMRCCCARLTALWRHLAKAKDTRIPKQRPYPQNRQHDCMSILTPSEGKGQGERKGEEGRRGMGKDRKGKIMERDGKWEEKRGRGGQEKGGKALSKKSYSITVEKL